MIQFILTKTFQPRQWKQAYGGQRRTGQCAELAPQQVKGRRSPNRKRSSPSEGRMPLSSCSEHWERSCTANVGHSHFQLPLCCFCHLCSGNSKMSDLCQNLHIYPSEQTQLINTCYFLFYVFNPLTLPLSRAEQGGAGWSSCWGSHFS